MKYLNISVLSFLLATGALAEVAEPNDYRGEPYRGEVPTTLQGAKVLHEDEDAHALWLEGVPFVDVLPGQPKPDLPEGTVWHEKPHNSIEGAIWLPNVGYEELADETMEYFKSGLEYASQGDKEAPIVIFCKMECWMSWNAAKRALEIGYKDVSWYPNGVDGWGQMDYPMEAVPPWNDDLQ